MHSFRRPVKIQFVKLRNSKLAYSRKDTTSSKMSRFYDNGYVRFLLNDG